MSCCHFVPVPVAGYLGFPKFSVASRSDVFGAILMSVPEAAVDKNYGFPAGQHDVRRAGKAFDMDTEPEATFMQTASDGKLRAGVFAPDACHALVALLFCHPVCHSFPLLFIFPV